MKQILNKMHKVMLDVEYIQKDAKNTHQKYTYASEKAIKEAFGKALREHGVVFQLSSNGDTYQVANAIYSPFKYTFYDVDTGESLEGTFTGAGQVRDDKGHYASVTGAIKYILTSNFLIATGDDPEANEKNTPESNPQGNGERDNLLTKVKIAVSHLKNNCGYTQHGVDEIFKQYLTTDLEVAPTKELQTLLDNMRVAAKAS